MSSNETNRTEHSTVGWMDAQIRNTEMDMNMLPM
jgi:hypothetical protein